MQSTRRLIWDWTQDDTNNIVALKTSILLWIIFLTMHLYLTRQAPVEAWDGMEKACIHLRTDGASEEKIATNYIENMVQSCTCLCNILWLDWWGLMNKIKTRMGPRKATLCAILVQRNVTWEKSCDEWNSTLVSSGGRFCLVIHALIANWSETWACISEHWQQVFSWDFDRWFESATLETYNNISDACLDHDCMQYLHWPQY